MTDTKKDGFASSAAPVSQESGLAPGTLIGEYQVEREIGRGGMGVVYAARHPVIGKRVAIKVLDLFFSRDAALVKRFTDEARAVNRIGHPNIIDVFSFGQLADGRQYFVMEFLEGETLASWLAKGIPPASEMCRLLLQACEALEAAHREGIIHRDLKPENLWIARPKHGESFIKVLDFGIAKLSEGGEEKSVTRTGTVMGTPQFMSPEQCTGRAVDHRTDVYAMGVILFRIYCGRFPFDGASVAEIIADQLYQPPPRPSSVASLPPALDELIFRCLDKDPALRPASAAELGMELKTAVQLAGAITEVHAPLHRNGDAAARTRKGFAPGTPDPDSDGEKSGSNKWRLVVVAGVVVVVGIVAMWFGLRGPKMAGPPTVQTAPSPAIAAPPSAPIAPAATPAIVPQLAPAPLEQVPRPLPARARASRVGAEKAESASASRVPASPPAAAEAKPKPSRAANQGLVEENPF
ncbi:MAG TPA: serine/threonine-protein kinase [Polyangia bacterium]|nr:serine/threonine-protein kinase [Polyangia bacterium]